jgi:hypothetical protein
MTRSCPTCVEATTLFWYEGTPAVLWTDTGDVHYAHDHQRTDTPETLDDRFFQSIGALLERARARSSP